MDPAPVKVKSNRPPSLKIDVELVTRQFGGGAAARTVDPDLWLRPSAVRGALRFWWRALNAHTYRRVEELRSAENEVFGSQATDRSAGPGELSLTVVQPRRDPQRLEEWTPPQGDALNGAYFPAQKMGKGSVASWLLRPGATATIGLDFGKLTQQQQAQVCQSLAAYVVFGGSGARTRRAAGSICFASAESARRLEAPYDLDSLYQWCERLPRGESSLGVFSVAPRDGIYITPRPDSSGELAQRQLLQMWREFRQHRTHPNTWMGATGWGRTKWPEADAIRFVTGQHARWESGTVHAPEHANKGRAPRAHLGLPIGMKFKDDELTRFDKATQQKQQVFHPTRRQLLQPEPENTELVLAENGKLVSDRYASPVILSVVRVADGAKSGYAGVVLVTPSLLGTGVSIRQKMQTRLDPGSWHDVKTKLTSHLERLNFRKVD